MTVLARPPVPRLSLAAAVSLTAFSAAALGAGLGRGLVTTYLPVLLDEIRHAPGLIGTVMLVNTAAGFVVPLWIGLWSDRLHARGHSRTGPFILGGSLLAAGGLAAIALGHASTYVFLALAAAAAYTGLNAVTTAHRALIPETFGESGRAAATSAEELALLGGTLAGVLVGGFLVEIGPWLPFVFGALALPLLALPTVRRMRGRERPPAVVRSTRRPLAYYARAARAPGARLVLVAQLLWVLGYIGLTPFFVLYADQELGLRPAAAGSLLAGFGIVTGLAIFAAGSVPSAYQARTVVTGVLLLGGGLLATSATTTLQFVAPALLAAAVGFGLVTTLGFPLFARYIPRGEEGAYTALYFAARSVAGAVAVPAAGWTIAIADSYRAVFVAGGAVTLLALGPLAGLAARRGTLRRPPLRRALAIGAGLAGVCAALLALAIVTTETGLAQADAEVFDALYGLGGTPAVLDAVLVHPHIQNYVALTLLAAVAAAVWRPDELIPVLTLVPLAGVVSFGIVRAIWVLWERPRPEEVLGVDAASAHLWAPYPSFPSGHVVVTVALVTAIASRIPWLGPPLAVYAAVIAVTRVSYGAHFPLDVVAGAVIGFATAYAVTALLTGSRLIRLPRPAVPPRPVSPAVSVRLRRIGLLAAAAAVVALLALALTVGPPHSPDGGIIAGRSEGRIQLAILALGALALLAGARWPALAGAALIACSTALGVLAAIEYTPPFAVGAFAALFVPGLLLVLGSRKGRTSRGVLVVTSLAVAVAAAGAVGAFRVHAMAFGPSHPESRVAAPPTDLVRWAWAGGVTDRGFRVVVKLAHDGEARLLVAEERGLTRARATASAVADDETNDRVLAFEVAGLRPGQRYFYAVETNGTVERRRIGSVETVPTRPFSFTVAAGSCARVGSNGAVFDAIRRAHPLLFLVIGDFFYGNIDENDPEAFRDQYDRALTRPAQAALYRDVPVDYVWDDHDFGGENRASASRPAALSTYGALAPHHALPAAGGIYHSFTVGRVRFIVTDTRSLRRDRTMLGERQKAWLERELLRSRDRGQLAVWVNSVPWIASSGADSWAGYPQERRELADFIARARIANLVMVSGDAHMVAIDDGRNSGYATTGEKGFPVLHAAALDRPGGVKGGPYSDGAFPGGGQFGTLTVDDTGGPTIRVTLAGWNYRGERIVAHTFSRVLGEAR